MIPDIPFVADDLLLVALYGGIVCGVGTGLVLLAMATTGGTDTLAALIQPLIPHRSIAQIMMVLDTLIVLAGLSTFGLHLALYALIAIFVLTKISDDIIEGLKFAKSIYIIGSFGDHCPDDYDRTGQRRDWSGSKGNVLRRRASDAVLRGFQKRNYPD